MENEVWSSEAIQLEGDTCVDIRANAKAVVLGQVGAKWFHDLHLTSQQARLIAMALNAGAAASDAAN